VDQHHGGKWADARQLFQLARSLGKRLSEADRMNFTVANVVKRIYHIIREECAALKLSLKDHLAIKGGKKEKIFIEVFLVPKDAMRMDSLKSISMS
jgi:translation initiation factor 2B subunit (eIF-2B alpha/beta/delta family)